jgi:hypothetical protein
MKSQTKPARIREGKYANYFEVGHNPFEFYFDFGQYDPPSENVRILTRILTSPNCAKMLLETLSSSIQNFEREHGPIATGGDDVDAMEFVRESLKRMEMKS